MTRWLRAILAGATLGVSACIAPTLPVPPPAQPDVTAPDSTGMVTLKGGRQSATPNATIEVWNQSLAESATCKSPNPACHPLSGKLVDSDGSWIIQIPAKSKDHLLVSQTIGNEQSASVDVFVP